MLITKSNWGGAQRYVYDLATKLPKDQFRVEVMAGGEGPLINKLMEAGISAHGSLPVGRDISFLADVKAAFKLISILRAKKPDVLHLNSSKIGGVGAFAGRLARVKNIVFTAHGWAFNENRPLYNKLFIIFLYWIMMILSHKVVAVSEAAARQVRGWPFLRNKITVVHNGVDPEAGYARSNSRLELTRLHSGLKKAVEGVSEANLVWIGTNAELHPIKGHEYAIRAVANCIADLKRIDSPKKIVYSIISSGQDRERLEKLIIDLGMQEHIFLMGFVAGASQYVKAFTIFVLASISEGLGYVLLEAGAGAVPIVATAVGGIPEIIEDMGSGILVQPRNSRDLAHAILFMVEHPKERAVYGNELRNKIKVLFTLDQMVSATKEVYLHTTAAPSPAV